MHFHIGPQESVDSGLIAGSFCFEPIEDPPIEPNCHTILRLGEDKRGRSKEVFVQFRNVRVINLAIGQGIHSCPISL